MKIVCTRESARNRPIIAELASRGVEGVSFPLIKTEAIPLSTDQQRQFVATLNDERSVLCMMSPNGVRYALRAVPPLLTAPRCVVAVQGDATAEAWSSMSGFSPSIIATGPTGADLGATILANSPALKHALLVGPMVPRPELAAVLTQGGLTVERLAVYRTDACPVPPESRRAFAEMGECWVLFFSPSSVRAFVDAELYRINEYARYAAFGPTTAVALREAGLHVSYEHHTADQRAFVDELCKL